MPWTALHSHMSTPQISTTAPTATATVPLIILTPTTGHGITQKEEPRASLQHVLVFSRACSYLTHLALPRPRLPALHYCSGLRRHLRARSTWWYNESCQIAVPIVSSSKRPRDLAVRTLCLCTGSMSEARAKNQAMRISCLS
jgi:hypothetical protein